MAKKMYAMYKEASHASDDFNQKEPMNTCPMSTCNSITVGHVTKFKQSLSSGDPFTNFFQFAPLSNQPQVCQEVPCAKPKGNNPMYVDNDKHIESSKINYLNGRVEGIFYQKDRALEKQFGLVSDPRPSSAKELVDRILAGKYVLPDGDAATKSRYEPSDAITWRDPAVKKDAAGYEAASAVLQKVRTDTIDTIAIGTPVEGLVAVKALDAWSFTSV